MSDTGFFPFLAEGPVHGRAEPAELRQTICPRLSGDARLGQDSACPASAERSDRKKFGEVRRGVSPPDGWRLGGRVSTYPSVALSCWVKRNVSGFRSSCRAKSRHPVAKRKVFSRDSSTSLRFARNDICLTPCKLEPPQIHAAAHFDDASHPA